MVQHDDSPLKLRIAENGLDQDSDGIRLPGRPVHLGLLIRSLIPLTAEGSFWQNDQEFGIFKHGHSSNAASPIDSILFNVHQAQMHVVSDSLHSLGGGATGEASRKFTNKWTVRTLWEHHAKIKLIMCRLRIPRLLCRNFYAAIGGDTEESFVCERCYWKRLYARGVPLHDRLHGFDER